MRCWRWSGCWCRGRTTRCYLETADARSPVEGACRGIVFVSVPEGAVVYWINTQRAVSAPAVAGAALTAGAVKEMSFTLSERVDWVGCEPGRVADLWIDRRTGSAKADGEVSLSIHRGATHPAPGRIRLIGALLINGHRYGRSVAQVKSPYSCSATCAASLIAYT